MNGLKLLSTVVVIGMILPACAQKKPQETASSTYEIKLTEAEWKAKLTPEEYYVMRQQGTERAFTGNLWNNKQKGTYLCKACDLPLFSSDTKYNSGTGWPSFYKPVNQTNVEKETDTSLGEERTEVHCSRCGGHLGHVFPDGPEPTGLRYCINSVSLKFAAKE